MPQYRPTIHTTAKRELDSLDSNARTRLTDVLSDIARTEEPSRHEKTKPLTGQRGMLRVRVGDLRAVVQLDKPELRVLAVGKRKNVYESVDELDRRASA